MSLKLHIIRGLPGAGKTTYATKLITNSNHELTVLNWREADTFFYYNRRDEDGIAKLVYEFDSNFIREAHKLCLMKTIESLFHGENAVVSNTFTTMEELEYYLNLKEKFPDLEIIIHELHTQFESIHNIPDNVMERMKARWIDLPESENYELIKVLP